MQWEQFASTNEEDTKSGYFKGSTRDTFLEWISLAWREISRETIKSGFEKLQQTFDAYLNLRVSENDEENEDSDEEKSEHEGQGKIFDKGNISEYEEFEGTEEDKDK